ncbi:3-oxoacyl-[acyl-carrier protein] reductase [Vibrio maritimus]|uniref:3-oxoacyl-[acyl-carrier protein] reductase n=1 Tax=Vibrio maritimus TaxID=990268 RepID=A0A090T4K2_9VIBR|nr:3-oxoacyl-[acyl-carrier protein] reductase [Vibrio maritimus]
MELEQSVIAITGAGQGLGQTMATSLAQQGASLALLDVNQDALTETKELCEAFGVKAQTYQVDVTNEEQVEKVFRDIVTEFGSLNGLVNNAGILRDGMLVKSRDGEISKMSLGDFNAVINVNLTGTFLCGREAAVQMIESDSRGSLLIFPVCREQATWGKPTTRLPKQQSQRCHPYGVKNLLVTASVLLLLHQVLWRRR